MACDNVFDAFAIATESLDQEVYRNASYRSVWLNAVPRGQFKTGTGTTQTTFTIENSEPVADIESWTEITNTAVSGGSGGGASGSCASTFTDVEVGYTANTYNPESYALSGPIVCKDDLIYDHNVDVFLRAYIEELTKRAQRSWEKRYEEIYMQFSSKLSVGNESSFVDWTGSGSEFVTDIDFSSDGGLSTSALTQQLLDQVAIELIDRGATNPDSNGFINFGEDGPVFPILIGLEASQQIALNNAELRQDFRDADSGAGGSSELMKRLGATRVIKNFRHIPNIRPPRYTFNSTTNKYQRVDTYTQSNATKGKKSTLNPAYKTAPYEAAIIMNPAVFTSEIVPPVNSAGGVSWNPTSYMGEWQHFAEFKHAARPEFPQYGMTLIFKRACKPENNTDIKMTEVAACAS